MVMNRRGEVSRNDQILQEDETLEPVQAGVTRTPSLLVVSSEKDIQLCRRDTICKRDL